MTPNWREHFYATLMSGDFVEAYKILGYQDGLEGEMNDYLVPPGDMRGAYLEGHAGGTYDRRVDS